MTDVVKEAKKYGNKIKFSNGIKPMITLESKAKSQKELLKEITQFLNRW